MSFTNLNYFFCCQIFYQFYSISSLSWNCDCTANNKGQQTNYFHFEKKKIFFLSPVYLKHYYQPTGRIDLRARLKTLVERHCLFIQGFKLSFRKIEGNLHWRYYLWEWNLIISLVWYWVSNIELIGNIFRQQN